MKRVWESAPTVAPPFQSLEEDITVDVVIIGAGITGLTTALQLLNKELSVAVVESHTVGAGDTGGSTGNLYATTSLGLTAIQRKWGDEVVRKYVAAREAALNYIEQTVARLSIDCQFHRRSLYRCVLASDEQLEQQLEDECHASRIAGLNANLITNIPSNIKFIKALKLEDQAQFDPLAYVRTVAAAIQLQGGQVFESSGVTEVSARKGIVKTDRATITAKHIVLATHTPIGFSILQTEMESLLEHGISARLKDNHYPEGIFWILDGLYSLRSYRQNGKTYLIAVGAKHKVGHPEFDQQYYQHLRNFVQTHFAVEAFEHNWSAQQFRSADLLPFIGRAPMEDNVYVGTGYAADGLIWGALAGTIISDLIVGHDNPWSDLFDPRRFTPLKSASAFLTQNTHVAKHYMTGYLTPAPCKSVNEVNRGEGRIVSVKGENLAVYRSDDGQLSAVSSVCTHMKCKVCWNAADTTWDCPCHGSRFDTLGNVIEGPALQPLAKRELPEDASVEIN